MIEPLPPEIAEIAHKATIWGVDGPAIEFKVEGTGSLADSAAAAGGGDGGEGGNGQPALTMNLPLPGSPRTLTCW